MPPHDDQEFPPPGPCIGCGFCCLRDPCEESHRLHGFIGRCPELSFSEQAGCYRCRLAGHPTLGAFYRKNLFMGEGCCWRDNPRRTAILAGAMNRPDW